MRHSDPEKKRAVAGAKEDEVTVEYAAQRSGKGKVKRGYEKSEDQES